MGDGSLPTGSRVVWDKAPRSQIYTDSLQLSNAFLYIRRFVVDFVLVLHLPYPIPKTLRICSANPTTQHGRCRVRYCRQISNRTAVCVESTARYDEWMVERRRRREATSDDGVRWSTRHFTKVLDQRYVMTPRLDVTLCDTRSQWSSSKNTGHVFPSPLPPLFSPPFPSSRFITTRNQV